MKIQNFNKKINDFKSTYDLAYFSLNCLKLNTKVGAIIFVMITKMEENVNYV